MKTLFPKIFFLWYCMSMVLVLVVTSTMVIALNSDMDTRIGNGISRHALHFLGQAAVEKYRKGGAGAVVGFFDILKRDCKVHVTLFSEARVEITGSAASESMSAAVEKAFAAKEYINLNYLWKPIHAVRIRGADNNTYVIVSEADGFLSPVLFTRSFFIRFAVILLAGVIFSFILARNLTSPIRKMQAATLKLSEGDFSVRVAEQIGERSDEIADLAKDIDNMAEKIASLKEAEERILGDISHELRSPLTRLGVALELARQRSGHNAAEYLNRIARETERLDSLIDQILVIAGRGKGMENGEEVPVDIVAVVRETVADANFEAGAGRCDVVVSGAETIRVVGNRELLKSAFENVVRNAIYYTDKDTRVEISIMVSDGKGAAHAVISVRDFGAGVPEDALKKLFHPFFRVDNARDRQTGGTGLGLAITERAVTLHNGFVTAENAGGGGLAVNIHLPFEHTDEVLPGP